MTQKISQEKYRQTIIRLLKKTKKIKIMDLVRELGVARDTAQRVLFEMEVDTRVIKSYKRGSSRIWKKTPKKEIKSIGL